MSSAHSPRRAPIEPLAPALVAVALAHGFAAFLLWMFIAAWAPAKKTLQLPKDFVWHSPSDFLVIQPPPPPVFVEQQPAEQPQVKAPANASYPTLAMPLTLQTDKTAPLVSAQMLASISSQASTLVAMLSDQKSGPMSLTINHPVSPVSSDEKTDPPVARMTEPEQPVITGPEANKYITILPVEPADVVPAPAPVKPVLSLLDVANLYEAQKKREASAGGADMEPVQSALEKAILSAWKSPTIKVVPASQRRVTLSLSILRDGSVEDIVVVTPSGSDLLDASVRAAAARVIKITQSLPSQFPKDRYDLQINFQIE